jgi:glycerol-3-phosphate acyltransferase PlsY
MAFLLAFAAVAAGYLLGSIPFGILICRILGKDPREHGSGRTGMSNVYRTAGAWPAAGTLAGDVLKATVAVWLARQLVPNPDVQSWVVAATALAAIVGHNYSIYLGFRGGAGASPNAGAMLAIDPLTFLIGGAVALGIWFGIRIAALATMSLSAIVLAGLLWRVFGEGWPQGLLLYGVGQLMLVLWALRPNIARLLRGEERVLQLDAVHRAGAADTTEDEAT